MKSQTISAKPQQPKMRNLPPADDRKVKGGYLQVKLSNTLISSYSYNN